MPAHLLIQDGAAPYWWTSPDIWVVPGNDPNGAPGSPVAGHNAYVWARVANTGNLAAKGARVDFYWANPAAQVAVGVATPIGCAFVDLDPGQSQEVLCLVPWMPVIVNGGHECVLAVAHASVDANALPDPLPTGYVFDPPAHDQIAQLNLSVLTAARAMAPMALMVSAVGRRDKQALLRIHLGGELDQRTLANLGLRGVKPVRTPAARAGLALQAQCCAPDADPGAQELKLHVARATSVPVFVTVQADAIEPGHYQLIHVIEEVDGRIVGGVSYVLANHTHQQEQSS